MENEKPKISVVVPMYNVEKYLKECLDSIVTQTFKDIEVILVNDLSADNTLSIAEEYAKQYSNFKLVTGRGQGLGGARNTGLENVNGEFCCFIDSDDVLPMNALEKLYTNAKMEPGVDIVIGNMVLYNETGLVRMPEFDAIHKYPYIVKDISKSHSLIGSQTACNKLFKTSLIFKNNLKFPENLVHEDLLFTPITFFFANKIKVIPDEVYWYRKFSGEQTITSNINEEFYFTDRIEILNRLDKYLNEHNALEYKNLIDLYKLKKFLVPFERKIYSLYTDEFSDRAMKALSEQLQDISYETIRKSGNKLFIEYLLLKERKFEEYKNYKKKNLLDLEAINGELYLQLDSGVPESLKNVTFIEKKLPLISEIEHVNIRNSVITLKGHAYIEGVSISDESLQIIDIFYTHKKNKSERASFSIIPVSRPDISYIYGNRYNYDACGFEATFNLNDLKDIKTNKYELNITYIIGGVEKTQKLALNQKFFKSLRKEFPEKLLYNVTNFTKRTPQQIMEKEKRNMILNIDKRSSLVNVEGAVDTYVVEKKHVIVSNGKVKITFDTPKYNNCNLIIYKRGKQIFEKEIKKRSVTIGLGIAKYFSILEWNLFIKDQDGYLTYIDTKKLINVNKLFNKYRPLRSSLFKNKKSEFGWYIWYSKTKGSLKK
ncbi:glycosyltransferase family 2 protein [Mesobacillus thioparans]|uniref:glycosyltransferase family 2 protein n=1 Tax=Mesobacillus thioparans TaxID=370439 RepID=UPI0039F05151